MAVYTPLTPQEVSGILEHYALGDAKRITAVAQGIQNTTYILVLENQQCILTIYEHDTSEDDLRFFFTILERCRNSGLPCPQVLPTRDGALWIPYRGKLLALQSFMPGTSINNGQITPQHTQQIGHALGRMHLSWRDLPLVRANPLSLEGWQSLYTAIAADVEDIAPGLHDTLREELAFLKTHWPHDLPTGIVHADLFPDNVFFIDDTLSAIIDFYFACNDLWAYELAVCVNAWCFDTKHRWDQTRYDALIDAYNATRPLHTAERKALPVLLRGAAVRFLLTRAHDWLYPNKNIFIQMKNPLEYLHKLQFHQQHWPAP